MSFSEIKIFKLITSRLWQPTQDSRHLMLKILSKQAHLRNSKRPPPLGHHASSSFLPAAALKAPSLGTCVLCAISRKKITFRTAFKKRKEKTWRVETQKCTIFLCQTEFHPVLTPLFIFSRAPQLMLHIDVQLL
jgi:hypothetical protein